MRKLARAAIEAYEAAQWQPVEEGAKVCAPALVYVSGIKRVYQAINPTGEQWWSTGIGAVTPSHIRPLPPAPRSEGE